MDNHKSLGRVVEVFILLVVVGIVVGFVATNQHDSLEFDWSLAGTKYCPVLGLHGDYIYNFREFSLLEDNDGLLHLMKGLPRGMNRISEDGTIFVVGEDGSMKSVRPQRITGEFNLKRTNPNDWMANEIYELERVLMNQRQVYKIIAHPGDKWTDGHLKFQLDRIEKISPPEKPPK